MKDCVFKGDDVLYHLLALLPSMLAQLGLD